jgi:hypothetical protein
VNLRAQVQLHARLGELYSNCPAARTVSEPASPNIIPKMSARAFTLPIRAFSRPQITQQAERYTCRRCLHTTQTQAQEATPVQIESEAPNNTLPISISESTTTAAYNPALKATQRDYLLSRTDRLVKRILPHSVRPQLLQHVDPMVLHGRERAAALRVQKHHEIVGVVVRTGRMDKTVSVRVAGRRWEGRIGKVRSFFVFEFCSDSAVMCCACVAWVKGKTQIC